MVLIYLFSYSLASFHLHSNEGYPAPPCTRLTFLPALEFAKKQGLPITLHCGEVHFIALLELFFNGNNAAIFNLVLIGAQSR